MSQSTAIPTITLNNEVTMPAIGYGVFRMEDSPVCEQATSEALEAGYRFIDTAAAYLNEEAVGRAIAHSGVGRGKLFVSTKLWVTDATYGLAKPAFERSLDRLGLDYVDLYIIHQPFNDYYGAWRAMVELMEQGRIRAIGVDNFDTARLADFLAFAGVKPAVNFIGANVFHQREEDLTYMRDRDVQMMAWSPLSAGDASLFDNPVLREIAAAHSCSVAQVVLRWFVQRGVVPVVKSANPQRMRENLDVFGFHLTESEMSAIAGLKQDGPNPGIRSSAAEVDSFFAVADKLSC